MNEQNINNGMNGGPGMPPPPPQGYMNMNGGPGMPPPPPQGYMNMNGGPGMPPPPPQGYMNMNGGPGMPPPPPQGYMNMNARPPQRRNPAVSPNRFRMFGIPVLVYAIICAACLYSNWSSILSAVLSIVSIVFISTCMVRYEKNIGADREAMTTGAALSKQSILIPYYILVFMMSVALSLTDEGYIIFGCNVGIIATEMYAVMTYFNDTEKHGIFKGIFSFFEMFFGSIGYVNMPFADRKAEREITGKKRNSKLMYILLGCVIALPILVIVLNLLSSADPVFAKVIKDIFGKLFFSWDIVKIVLFAAVIFLFVYGFIVKAGRRDLGANAPKEGQYNAVTGITITIVLTAFYLIFAVVQIVYLFMNSAGLPDDMTYAEYARQGFFQLLFVAVVNVCMVLIFSAIFRKSLVLNVSLLMMCICTYIMIASSAVRLSMYIAEYDLTYLRINTIWALIVTSIVMLGVIISLFWRNMPLFRYIFMTVLVMFTLYAFIRPGAVITRYNISQAHDGKKVDLEYVMDIGNDGVPYLIDYFRTKDITPEMVMEEVMSKYSEDTYYWRDDTVGERLEKMLEENDDKGYIRSFNFSRYRASKTIEDYIK